MHRRLVFALGTDLTVAALRESLAGEASAGGKKLVVVAPSEFERPLAEFLAHKARQLPTECVALEDVLNRETGVDDPEKLKRFLFQQWRDRLAELRPTADWYPPSIFFQGMKFMVFGDPSLLMPGP